MSTKATVIQGILMYEIIAKRKVALDQLCNGLKILGILDEMQRYPQLFECAFTRNKSDLTSERVNDYLKFPADLTEQEENVKCMMKRFIDESESDRLTQFVQYCTGSKSIPLVHNFQIQIKFESEGYFHSSTCTFTLTIPNNIVSYGLLETALNSVIANSGKIFTTF